MKAIITALTIGLSALGLQAQTLDRSFLSSGGSSLQNSSFKINFSIGDIAVQRGGSSVDLNQGFQQSYVQVVESIVESDTLEFAAYPIPFGDRLYLRMDESMHADLLVEDNLGKVVWKERSFITKGEDKVLDLSSLSAGVYFLSVKGALKSNTVRLVKF